MNKILLIISTVFIVLCAMLGTIILKQKTVLGGTSSFRNDPTFYKASSTAFTLTTASQRLLATSTGSQRVAVTIQPTNCTTAQAVYVTLNQDVAATAGTGIAIVASSTLALGGYTNIPVVQGAVTGITGLGTCTVLVTEWRSQY
jgi:hypothetical protein